MFCLCITQNLWVLVSRPVYLQLFLANHHVPTTGGRGDAVVTAREAEEG